MSDPRTGRTVTLLNREWQGGQIDDYYLGARLLEVLAPEPAGPTIRIAVTSPEQATEADRKTVDGIDGYSVVVQHLQEAQRQLDGLAPDRIVVLGGDCSAEIPAVDYLSDRYGDGFAVLWVDAHPDLWVPGHNSHFNAMALSALLGDTTAEVTTSLRRGLQPAQVHWVGLRAELDPSMPRLDAALSQRTTAEAVNRDPSPVIDWLKGVGARQVMVHIDLDSLEPAEFALTAVPEPGGVTFAGIRGLCAAVAAGFDLVGIGVVEHAPRQLSALRRLLHELPLLSES